MPLVSRSGVVSKRHRVVCALGLSPTLALRHNCFESSDVDGKGRAHRVWVKQGTDVDHYQFLASDRD